MRLQKLHYGFIVNRDPWTEPDFVFLCKIMQRPIRESWSNRARIWAKRRTKNSYRTQEEFFCCNLTLVCVWAKICYFFLTLSVCDVMQNNNKSRDKNGFLPARNLFLSNSSVARASSSSFPLPCHQRSSFFGSVSLIFGRRSSSSCSLLHFLP